MPDNMTQPGNHTARENESGRIVPGMSGPADSTADPETELASILVTQLNAVRSQDRDAFVALYDATVQRVFSLALRITRQREMAEEVVSDVYLQVWQKADTYAPERGKVIAWLCMLCRSRALDALRRDNTAIRQSQVGLDAVSEPEDANEPPDILHAVEQKSAIHSALGELSEQQRQLVALAYFRGFTHSELAAFTNSPIGTVKTHLHRAMIKLKEAMSVSADIDGESDE